MHALEIERAEHWHSTIQFERDCHSKVGEILRALLPAPRKVALISDRNVASLHGEAVEQSLRAARYEVKDFLIPPGEESKSYKMLGNLWDRLLTFGMSRDDIVVALGGGVVGDLAGFAAATLQRGIEVVQIPTSLVAQTDSAIGGKTGINSTAGKNLVGAFHHPRLVLIDPKFLDTLPEREFRSGLAEVIKYGWIRDPGIHTLLESHVSAASLLADARVLDEIVLRSARIKADVVRADPREQGDRIHLNYGHTIGHALEAATRYQTYLHGEAVAVGMVAAAYLGVSLGVSSPDLPAQTAALLERFELPTSSSLQPGQLLPYVSVDKKRRRGKSRWVLVAEPGRCVVAEDPDPDAVMRSLEAIYRAPPPPEEAVEPPANT